MNVGMLELTPVPFTLSRMFAPGSAIQRKVVAIGTEKADVDSKLGSITKKDGAEQKGAEEILKNVKNTYGVEISSAKLFEGIKTSALPCRKKGRTTATHR